MAADAGRMIQLEATLLKAYRWQYIVSGVIEPRFRSVLGKLVDAAQRGRIEAALAPLMYAMPAPPPALAACGPREFVGRLIRPFRIRVAASRIGADGVHFYYGRVCAWTSASRLRSA